MNTTDNTPTRLQPADITLTPAKKDTNGNPRYIVHFCNFLTKEERGYNDGEKYIEPTVSNRYGLAVARARTIGGRKYTGKDYGGGIVFQSYNIHELKKYICELVNSL